MGKILILNDLQDRFCRQYFKNIFGLIFIQLFYWKNKGTAPLFFFGRSHSFCHPIAINHYLLVVMFYYEVQPLPSPVHASSLLFCFHVLYLDLHYKMLHSLLMISE